ncbi:hypothetical protein RBB78_21565 [Tunturiibacter empetritectus]|uniref:hypothetical protein n=1 Tax=Tunturiibacter empetritectus TaxID=3069691 RepID=UPI003D9B002A
MRRTCGRGTVGTCCAAFCAAGAGFGVTGVSGGGGVAGEGFARGETVGAVAAVEAALGAGGEAAGFAWTTEAGLGAEAGFGWPVAEGAAGRTCVPGVCVGTGRVVAARRAGVAAVATEAGLAGEAFALAAEGAWLGEGLAGAVAVSG